MRIISLFDKDKSGAGVVEMSRKELRNFFPDSVTDLLPEEPTEYAFGVWSSLDDKYLCPTMKAKLKLNSATQDEQEKKVWRAMIIFDTFCQKLADEPCSWCGKKHLGGPENCEKVEVR